MLNKAYDLFLEQKVLRAQVVGLELNDSDINQKLYDFQRAIVLWALRLGRAAVFADCGLGKSFIQIEWARLIQKIKGGVCLIVAPLSVAEQTIAEALKLRVKIKYAEGPEAIDAAGLWITNYERVEKFVGFLLSAVVLDESSILKSIDGKTRKLLLDHFTDVPYRLCCTATPCPNDIAEIANHAQFLSIMTRQEMLGMFFVHDQDGWRLRGHARAGFFRWMASWAMALKSPSDLGYDGSRFKLPELRIQDELIETEVYKTGTGILYGKLGGITGRSKARKQSVGDRVDRAVRLAESLKESLKGQGIIWCGLNDEALSISKRLNGLSVEIHGSQSSSEKRKRIVDFTSGVHRILVTKPSIVGFGLNLQNANWMIFLGLNDSYETYYQCIRRVWRFGQKRDVDVYIVLTDREAGIAKNVWHKEQESNTLTMEIIASMKEWEVAALKGKAVKEDYAQKTHKGNGWELTCGDSVEEMKKMKDSSIDLSVFSPPFLSLYTYSESERDMGNSLSEDQFFTHFQYVIDHLLRVTKPGRNCCVHVANVIASLVRDGFIGIKNFRGHVVDKFVASGWVYHAEVAIDKDPQAVAIRTHAKGLGFGQLKKDASWMSPALADYILVFRKPGDNVKPVTPDVSNEEWIEWARPIWYNIRPTDTLNTTEAKSEKDDRHIAPLQLGVIERCVRLWSSPGDTVFSPFAGIGSEGFVAVSQKRKFKGIELKDLYAETAVKNLMRAENKHNRRSLLKSLIG